MATFNLSADGNIDSLSGKTGGDIYNLLGYTLTVDQDSRHGLNQTTSTSLANIVVSATAGGNVIFDARKVRYIAYTGGSGNVPAYNTAITRGSSTGKMVSVQSALTAAPTAPGAAMPASGFIKIKQWNDVEYTAGALGGITATASGASVVGTIEIVGDEGSAITANRLGTAQFLGEWYELGTTSGTANQTFQVPTNGLTRYIAGVFIEKTPGGGDFEFYPSTGSATSLTADIRAKVVWTTTAGVVRLGHNGTSNAGYTPVSGCRVVIGNILLENCTTAARTANALPSATLATRYDFLTTGGGVLSFDKVNAAWYLLFSQPYSISISNTGTLESLNISECATDVTLYKVGVGQTAAQTNFGLVLSLNFSGGTVTDCTFSRSALGASGNYTSTITDCSNFTFVGCTFIAYVKAANATTGASLITRCVNMTFTGTRVINGRLAIVTCSGVTFTTTSYCDTPNGTTATAIPFYVWDLSVGCTNIKMDGLDFFGLTNVQPYSGILLIGTAGCTNIKLRNIGTPSAPLSLGSVNGAALVVTGATGGFASNVKVQRVYVSNTRTNIWSFDNSNTGIVMENVSGDYADAPIVAHLNGTTKGIAGTVSLTAQVGVYGSHWVDNFTSATVGRLQLLMNEATEGTAAQVALANGAAFTSAGSLYMPTIGQTATFETPYFIIGHTAFPNTSATMAGGTIGNYRFYYQIDLNNGSGWSTISAQLTAAQLATALNGLTLDAALGFKMRLVIETTTTNATAITSLYIPTTSSAAAQQYEYPLDTFTLTLTGLQAGSDVVVLAAGTSTILNNVDAAPGTSWGHVYATPQSVDIGILKAGFVPLYIRGYSLLSADASIPVAQTADRNYS